MKKKIALLTSGGDAPGMNAATRQLKAGQPDKDVQADGYHTVEFKSNHNKYEDP